MEKLSWQNILEIQQQDFIPRLKYSLYSHEKNYDEVRLSHLSTPLQSSDNHEAFNEEFVKISFSESISFALFPPEEECLDNFCCNQADKYASQDDRYTWEDYYANCFIGKLGEEAVKRIFRRLISEVDYNISDGGDSGIDFYLTKNKNIGIQVKTKPLYRIFQENIDVNEKLEEDGYYDYLYNPKKSVVDYNNNLIDNIFWIVNEQEINKNKIFICLLMTGSVRGDIINHKSFIVAGFKPTNEIQLKNKFGTDKYCLKIDELLYGGGIYPYLKTFIK